ncbi:MAG: DNA-directed RNA polymerase subunit omega [Acidobacteria bacterium]|nr:DNA-directed RNA polymerase subunit omega [Acidobacteriota bacterium]MCI0622000.1 DNA-directed RNA polymerase subunit omega [Acidobacteriota bacterium]MCI0723384.1 DNA-directed RNA polymerase subunit omega [Acidobacteriota bacterium]
MTSKLGSIDSKFRYIIVAAKRTRQLQAGSKPMVSAQSRKFTRIAQEEVTSGLVKFDLTEEPKASKKRGSKEGKEKGH